MTPSTSDTQAGSDAALLHLALQQLLGDEVVEAQHTSTRPEASANTFLQCRDDDQEDNRVELLCVDEAHTSLDEGGFADSHDSSESEPSGARSSKKNQNAPERQR